MQTSLYKISGLHGVVFSGKYDAMQILYGVGLHGVGLHGVGLHVRVVPAKQESFQFTPHTELY